MPLAVVMPKHVLGRVANVQIHEAVVVVIRPSGAPGKTSRCQGGSSEGAVRLLTKEQARATILSVDEQVNPPVVVEVNPGSADRTRTGTLNGTHCDLCEDAIAVIPVEQIRSGIVATDVEVQQAVTVEIHPGAALAIGVISHLRPGGDLGEGGLD